MTDHSKKEKCDIHGDYESRPITVAGTEFVHWTVCPVCNQISVDETAKEKAELKKQKWFKSLASYGIPERFYDETLKTYKTKNKLQSDTLKICEQYVSDFDRVFEGGTSLIFTGQPGTGKTHLAIGIGKAFRVKGKTMCYSSILTILSDVKESWDTSTSLNKNEVIRKLVEVDFLIVDEIGVQFGTKTERDIIFEFMNERYVKVKPTIIISNKNLENIKNLIGERVIDRLRQNGGKAIEFNWESYRK